MASDQRPIIIADDFTGACDTGAQLANPARGCPVLVAGVDGAIASGRAVELLTVHDRLVVDTESRHLSPRAAAARVATVAADVRATADVVYKKIDSTLRGNISAEVEALVSVFPDRSVVLAPAFPAAGRTTQGGLCLVNGVPVSQTEFARDRLSPVRTARVADLIDGFARTAECAAGALQGAIGSARPGSAIVADASSEEDLAEIASAVAGQLDRLILVGSAGFARALGSLVGGGPGRGQTALQTTPGAGRGDDRQANPHAVRPVVLGLVGSLSERSRHQARELSAERPVTTGPPVTALELRIDDASAQAAGIISLLSAGTDVLLLSPESGAVGAATAAGGCAATPAEIARLFGRVAAEAVRTVAGVRLFATGGDTALAAIRAIGADSLLVRNEIAAGVPVSTLTVVEADGPREIQIVTKAGGFGENGIMIEAFDCLREDRCLQ